MEVVREVILDEPVGTMAIMEYADAHPSESFDCTIFCYEKREYGYCIVSDCDADNPYVWDDYLHPIEQMPNGWERTFCGGREPSWYCRKNGRCLFITN